MRAPGLTRSLCRVLLFMAVSLLGQVPTVCFGEVPAAQLESILASIRSARKQVKSARLVVRTETSSDVPESQLYKLGNLIELPRRTEEFAFRGNQRYLKRVTTSRTFRDPSVPQPKRVVQFAPGVKPPAAIEMPAERSKILVFNDGQCYLFSGNIAQRYSSANFQAGAGPFLGLEYPGYISWHLPDPTDSAEHNEQNRRMTFPDNLLPGLFSARFEDRDGQQMLRIERSFPKESAGRLKVEGIKETMWLDPRFGWMIVERVAGTTGDKGRTMARNTYTNPIRVLGEFWIPGKVVSVQFAPEAAVAEYGKDRPWVTRVLEATVSDVNQVADEIFVPKLKPGMVVIDLAASPDVFKIGEPVVTHQVDADGKIPAPPRPAQANRRPQGPPSAQCQ